MTPTQLLAYCLDKPGAWKDEPWEGDVVAKVGDKIFAFLGSGGSVGLKCGRNRDEADEWLARYPDDVTVMPYIGRHGWNTFRIGGGVARRRASRDHRRLLRRCGEPAAEEQTTDGDVMARTIQVSFDCSDPGALAAFWAEALGYRLDSPPQGFDSMGRSARRMGRAGGPP